MSPAQTPPETLDAFALELQEVQWFGRSSHEAVPARVTPLDLLLLVLGTLAAMLHVLSRT